MQVELFTKVEIMVNGCKDLFALLNFFFPGNSLCILKLVINFSNVLTQSAMNCMFN